MRALGGALKGSGRQLLVISGLALLMQGRIATEEDVPAPSSPCASKVAAITVAARGMRVSTVRLPPSTRGAGDHGFVPIRMARLAVAGPYHAVAEEGVPVKEIAEVICHRLNAPSVARSP